MTHSRNTEPSPIRAVQRALDVLACFEADRPSASLSELARQTALPSTTVARLLSTLVDAYFLRRLPNGRYAPGLKMFQLGLAALQNVGLYDISEPHLERLVEATGETANLAILNEEGRPLYLRQVPSHHTIRHANWVGRTIPATGTATGAALRGEAGVEGYTFTRQTVEPDVTAIAAPVYGPNSEILGAFNIVGPIYRISDDDIPRLGRIVVEEAKAASKSLGGEWPEYTKK
jgi:IclR family transcriptional regulator, acetate operon repressor